ncbi:Kinesin-like protein KIN-UC [Bienertia sinuspersici]
MRSIRMFQDNNQLKCNCGLPVGRRTSWTERNPDRRFMCCKFYDSESERRGCNYFRSVTNKLVLEKKLLECQLNTCQTELKEVIEQRSLLLEDNSRLKMKYKAVLTEMKLQKKKPNNKKVGGISVCCKAAIAIMLVLVIAAVVVML